MGLLIDRDGINTLEELGNNLEEFPDTYIVSAACRRVIEASELPEDKAEKVRRRVMEVVYRFDMDVREIRKTRHYQYKDMAAFFTVMSEHELYFDDGEKYDDEVEDVVREVMASIGNSFNCIPTGYVGGGRGL